MFVGFIVSIVAVLFGAWEAIMGVVIMGGMFGYFAVIIAQGRIIAIISDEGIVVMRHSPDVISWDKVRDIAKERGRRGRRGRGSPSISIRFMDEYRNTSTIRFNMTFTNYDAEEVLQIIDRFRDRHKLVGTQKVNISKDSVKSTSSSQISAGDTVFAYWNDGNGYYYSATVNEVFDNDVDVTFLLDGVKNIVPIEQVVDLQKALNTMRFEGNWKRLGVFYEGKLSSHQPIIMNYNDGFVEEVQLKQLRGTILV